MSALAAGRVPLDTSQLYIWASPRQPEGGRSWTIAPWKLADNVLLDLSFCLSTDFSKTTPEGLMSQELGSGTPAPAAGPTVLWVLEFRMSVPRKHSLSGVGNRFLLSMKLGCRCSVPWSKAPRF